jgi:hypothetical protein
VQVAPPQSRTVAARDHRTGLTRRRRTRKSPKRNLERGGVGCRRGTMPLDDRRPKDAREAAGKGDDGDRGYDPDGCVSTLRARAVPSLNHCDHRGSATRPGKSGTV